MARMVTQVLEFVRARHDVGVKLERRTVDLHDVCKQAFDEVRDANPGAPLSFQASGPARALWDPDRMAQVVTNLLSNALSHGEPGGPVTAVLRDEPGEISFSVHNCGEPIPGEVRASIFDPFRKVEGARTSGGGMGLGLYIVAEIVRAHGGHVRVRSSRAHGTMFTVVLPRVSG
jgi:signal transduction histidine kinase